jgi:hypothetical protein
MRASVLAAGDGALGFWQEQRDACVKPREHGVEGVGEFAELVFAAFQLDPVGE